MLHCTIVERVLRRIISLLCRMIGGSVPDQIAELLVRIWQWLGLRFYWQLLRWERSWELEERCTLIRAVSHVWYCLAVNAAYELMWCPPEPTRATLLQYLTPRSFDDPAKMCWKSRREVKKMVMLAETHVQRHQWVRDKKHGSSTFFDQVICCLSWEFLAAAELSMAKTDLVAVQIYCSPGRECGRMDCLVD